MATEGRGCGCGGGTANQRASGAVAVELKEDQSAGIKPGLINRKMTLLISTGAAMAGNCEPCLEKLVSDLKNIGVPDAEIHQAIFTGQMVKERPFAFMKETADRVAGTNMAEKETLGDWASCPAEEMPKDDAFKKMMLIAAASAMAANCEFCLNKVVPDLIEAGVSQTDIRRAVEIGQAIKDKPAAIMKEAADILTGSQLSDGHVTETCPPGELTKGAGCC